MEKNGAPLFIVGCERSGTTLLRLMITSHPEYHILHETGFLRALSSERDCYEDFTTPKQRWYFIRDLQRYQPTSETYSFSAFDLTDQEAESALADAAPLSFFGAARTLFQASAQKHGASRWGDKTPKHALDVPWIAASYPDAQFLHIIRDGRDVAASFRNAGWEKNLRDGAQRWHTHVSAAHEAGRNLSSARYKEVQYEHLVNHPEQTLQSLCEWLNIAYSPSMLHFHEESASHLPDAHEGLYVNTHHIVDASRAQAWKNSLSPREIADVEEVADDTLQNFGYELVNARVPLWLRSLRLAQRAILPLTRSTLEKMRRLGLLQGLDY